MDVMDERDARVWEKHSAELTRFATTLVGPTRAEDVVADAVLTSMATAGWRDVADHRAYLFRAVHNQAKMLHRSEHRRTNREHRAADVPGAVATERWVEVRDAMSRLGTRERAVLYLAYWLDLPTHEISDTLGLSRRTTLRALEKARRILERNLS